MSQFPAESHHDAAPALTGRACCTYCHTEFDARQAQHCPICAITGHSRRQAADIRPQTPSEEDAS
jgi:hypothetical protein